jgi:transcriptional regulator with XRE-family HTH domain
MPSLGKLIKTGRERKGMTVRGFAAAIGVAPPFVTDMEADRRRPGPEVLARIAEVLELPEESMRNLDPRLSPEVKEWIAEEPRVSSLLRQLRDAPARDELLQQMENIVRDADADDAEDD